MNMNEKVTKRKREDSVLPSIKRGSSSEAEILAPAITTVICNRCGHEVPEMNWAIHNSTCQHRSGESSKEGSATNETSRAQEVEERVEPANICATENVERSSPMAEGVRQEEQDPDPETVDTSEHAQWECPRCTLLNPNEASFCGACYYIRMLSQNNRSIPSNTGNENGMPQQPQPPQMPGNLRYNITVQEVNHDSIRTVNNLVSGVLIGTLAGGGIGGLIGLMGGAIVDGVTRWNNHRADRVQSSQETEPILRPTDQSDNRSTARTQHPRRGGIRIVQIRTSGNGLGATGSDGDPIGTVHPMDRMILQMLMLSALTQGTDNVDQMTFEELFQRFGVENEHRGASQEVIDQIPLQTFHNDDDEKNASNDKPVCNICLEEFQTGDEIRKLSCLHRFHKQCIDRWLGTVASCPICKHEIGRNVESHTNSADTSNQNIVHHSQTA
uniref:RING-type domain-containing protein n=1 Tax=Attheya septentrionalis TaxID=420275 RepID=A0A7S2UR21_9STRA|mmetsp:Transcript_8934/g.16268  ORF Transcript_8934/g.16268 Transcript_8934/m.16268 type:complete len:442 (+) Transcript_8934:72-1397(+)